MPNGLPSGTQAFEFGGMALHGRLRSWQDTRKQRIAVHEFDRRDGGQTEPMGRAPAVLRTDLLFVDAEGIDAARKFVVLVEANPTRLLVHPIYGKIQMTAMGLEGASFNVDQAINQYVMPVEFVESNLDGRIVATVAPGVGTQSAQVRSASSASMIITASLNASAAAVTSAMSTFSSALASATSAFNAGLAGKAAFDSAISSAMNTFDGAVRAAQLAFSPSFNAALAACETASARAFSFAASVSLATTSGTFDPSLSSQLLSVVSAVNSVIAAIRVYVVDAPSGAAVVQSFLSLLARCYDLGSSFLAQHPSLLDYLAPEPVHVLELARQFYGVDALSRVVEIQQNNPQLGAGVVPAGTRLKMAPPTV